MQQNTSITPVTGLNHRGKVAIVELERLRSVSGIMSIRIVASVIFCGFVFAVIGQAATVFTPYGERTGFVIVRQFDETVVTIRNDEERLFQFYSPDVIAVTADADVLVATGTILRSQPEAEASAVVELVTGTECIPVDPNAHPLAEWVEVSVWGDQQGWVQRVLLSDEVVFNAEQWNELQAGNED